MELAARLLRHAGVDAEVKRKGGEDKCYIKTTTDKLAAGREELRKALAEIVRKTVETAGWMRKRRSAGWRSWRGAAC